jgi:hypothetical protein
VDMPGYLASSRVSAHLIARVGLHEVAHEEQRHAWKLLSTRPDLGHQEDRVVSPVEGGLGWAALSRGAPTSDRPRKRLSMTPQGPRQQPRGTPVGELAELKGGVFSRPFQCWPIHQVALS